MKNALRCITLLTMFAAFTGCDQNYTADSEKLENVDFKKFKTYAWLPEIDSITVGGIDRYQLKNAIFDNIDLQLFKRGMSIDTIKPDVLVRYMITMNNSTNIVSTPIYENRPTVSYGMGYGRYGGYGTVGVYSQPVQVGETLSKVPYRNGQLIIEVIDLSTNKIVWRGYAYGSKEEDYQNAAISSMRSKAHTIINDIFWKFPIRKKS